MERTAGRGRGPLVSNGLAVASIAILFAASLAGWILTEIVPSDFLERRAQYEAAWGKSLSAVTAALRLFDPFHSLWYRACMAFFIITLVLCIATRLLGAASRLFRLAPPAAPEAVDALKTYFELSWRPILIGPGKERDPLAHYSERYGRRERVDARHVRAGFSRAAEVLSRRGYRVVSREEGDRVLFAAAAGRARHAGTLLFHIGILIVAVGGIVGSFGGWSATVFGKAGDAVPLGGGPLSVAIRDFEIVMNERGEVRDYVTAISILEPGGDTLAEGSVEVNRPFAYGAYRIHQSEFYPEERSFSWARIEYELEESMEKGVVTIRPGERAALGGSNLSLAVRRYFPDFRIGPEGPSSASPYPNNPAVEVEIEGGETTEKGYLFLHHPGFDSDFSLHLRLGLAHLEPVFYTGLLVSRSPGEYVIFAGIAAGTIGLLLLYLVNPRTLRGVVDPERIRVAAVEYRWKASFASELASLERSIAEDIASALGAQGGAS